MKSASPLRNLSTRVPPGAVGLFWLGQNGFVIKTPGGLRIALDPYLSNSCEAAGESAGLNMKRLFPAPIRPADMRDFDAVLFSHSHQDHVDPDTVVPYLKSGSKGLLVAPHEAADLLKKLGAPEERIRVTWPNHVQRIGDVTLRTTFAIPYSGDDLTHVGFLLQVRGAPTIYFTCDTDMNDVLPMSVGPHKPDVMVAVINGGFRNLSSRQAAEFAKAIDPRWVVPCHHDLFPDNLASERTLRTNLSILGLADRFCPLEHGKLKIFRKSRG